MNREIKFRCWDFQKKCFRHKYLMLSQGIVHEQIIAYSGPHPYSESLEWSQYTGLKDKNGKEIYEGDIIASRGNYITDEKLPDGNYPDILAIVVWDDKTVSYKAEVKDQGRWYLSPFREVIGNIYEHPDCINEEFEERMK